MIMSGVKERDEGGQGTTVSIFGGPTAPLGSLQHALARSWFGLSRVFLLISLAFFSQAVISVSIRQCTQPQMMKNPSNSKVDHKYQKAVRDSF